AGASGERGRLPGPQALLFHGALETLAIDGEPALRRHLLGEIDEKAVRVVQHEYILAAEPLVAARDQGFEALDPLLVGAKEALLLAREYAEHAPFRGRELGVIPTELLDHLGGGDGEEGLAESEHASLSRRTAHQPAQHV